MKPIVKMIMIIGIILSFTSTATANTLINAMNAVHNSKKAGGKKGQESYDLTVNQLENAISQYASNVFMITQVVKNLTESTNVMTVSEITEVLTAAKVPTEVIKAATTTTTTVVNSESKTDFEIEIKENDFVSKGVGSN